MPVPQAGPPTTQQAAEYSGTSAQHVAEYTRTAAQLLAVLRRELPEGALSAGPEATAPYAADRSGSRPDGTPLAVVHATRTEHVQTALRHAHALRVPVVPRGAGTGLSGGANAGARSVVLDLSRMNRIHRLSPEE
jgi:glycolate oxidase